MGLRARVPADLIGLARIREPEINGRLLEVEPDRLILGSVLFVPRSADLGQAELERRIAHYRALAELRLPLFEGLT
jgi:hypothetical protein